MKIVIVIYIGSLCQRQDALYSQTKIHFLLHYFSYHPILVLREFRCVVRLRKHLIDLLFSFGIFASLLPFQLVTFNNYSRSALGLRPRFLGLIFSFFFLRGAWSRASKCVASIATVSSMIKPSLIACWINLSWTSTKTFDSVSLVSNLEYDASDGMASGTRNPQFSLKAMSSFNRLIRSLMVGMRST